MRGDVAHFSYGRPTERTDVDHERVEGRGASFFHPDCQLTVGNCVLRKNYDVGGHVTSRADHCASLVKSGRFAFPDPNQKRSNGNYRHYTKVCVRVAQSSSIRRLR